MTRCLLALGVVWAWLLAPRVAEAEAPLDVAAELHGVDLGPHIAFLQDQTHQLTLEQVAAPALAARFDPDEPGKGFLDATCWLRLSVRNSASTKRSWLLELAYPHLDYVSLYQATPHGYARRDTGDMRPFAARDLSHRNFVFMLEEPPGGERTYYLSIRTQSSMTLPLSAWTTQAFIEHQHVEWAVLCMFYGVLLVMACYNACLLLFTRQREYLYFVLEVLALALLQATLVGHTFQFILPTRMDLVQPALPASMALTVLGATVFARKCRELPPLQGRWFDWQAAVALVALAVSCFAPYRVSIRLTLVLSVLVSLGNTGFEWAQLWRSPTTRLATVSWLLLNTGTSIAGFRAFGLLPTNLLTVWSLQIGACLHFVLISAHLAGRLNKLRADVDGANQSLAIKVSSLEEAVSQATEATERAEQAARVKDEFMATMSHELRTPLNAIINLPPGLLRDFPIEHFVICPGCGATFQLEPDEDPGLARACPDCGKQLVAEARVEYRGTPAHTLRYLQKIERSGTHLLQVVNGILDAEQVKSGQLALTFGEADVALLTREVVEEMSDLSERGGVRLELENLPDETRLVVDRLRLRQVLINLISNAIKFSDRRGSVYVRVEARSDGLRFAVRDEGIGIAPGKLATLFGSFEQVHQPEQRRFGGTGLGLFIARSLVRKHGGELWVESQLGEGATFFFNIPRRERARSVTNVRDSQVLSRV